MDWLPNVEADVRRLLAVEHDVGHPKPEASPEGLTDAQRLLAVEHDVEG